MGRTKYFTLAERRAAAKVHRDNYNQSDRGRQKRAEAQRRYRFHKKSLPESLVAMALRPLPSHSSFFFQQALQSADNLDETGLDDWDRPPPYQSLPTSNLLSDQQYTLRLIEVLDGRRLRIYRADARSRKLLYDEGRRLDVKRGLQTAMREMVEHWEQLGKLLKGFTACEQQQTIAHHLHEWYARWAYYMAEELDMLT